MAEDLRTATKGSSARVEFDGAGEYVLDRRTRALVEQLSRDTAWDPETLTDQVGRPAAAAEAADVEGRADWAALLALLAVLVAPLQTTWDRRRAVMLWSELVAAVEGAGLRDAVARVREVLDEPREDDLSPLGYLRLGEVDQSAERARALLRGGENRAAAADPYRAAPLVHLGATRIELYLGARRDLLGEGVFEAIKEHVASCPACRDAVAFLARGRGVAEHPAG